jgi:hypothetical protein
MLRSRQLWAIALVAMFFVPAIAKAQFKTGDWELTLGATGSNGPNFNGVNAGGNGSLGYFFTPNIELGVRQGLQYTDIGTGGSGHGSSLQLETDVPLDYHFDLGRWQPFVGVNIGYIYGDAVHNTFEAGPEAGVKWFANDTTFIYLLADYEFPFDKHSNHNAFSNGIFNYGLGIGFRF